MTIFIYCAAFPCFGLLIVKYVLVNKRKEGTRRFKDVVKVSGKLMKHFQVEQRNGMTYMRMKTRTLTQY